MVNTFHVIGKRYEGCLNANGQYYFAKQIKLIFYGPYASHNYVCKFVLFIIP